MSRPRQMTPDGLLTCSACRQPKPLNEFNKDTNATFGKCWRCKDCSRKVPVNEPEIALVAFAEVEKAVYYYRQDRTLYGFWRKVVEAVAAAPVKTAVKVRIESDFYSHYGAQERIRNWAVKLKVPVMVLHGENFVLVKRAVGIKRKQNVKSDKQTEATGSNQKEAA